MTVPSAERGKTAGYEDGLELALWIIRDFPLDITYCEALERIDWVRPTWKSGEEPKTYKEGWCAGRSKAAEEVAEILKEMEGAEP